MVDIEELYPGDLVRIVDKWVPGCGEASDGGMDKWLGKVMTVKGFTNSRTRVIMVEDDGECEFHKGGHWYWSGYCIAEVVSGSVNMEAPDMSEFMAMFE